MELIGLAILIIMCVVAPWIIKTILEFMRDDSDHKRRNGWVKTELGLWKPED